MSSTITYTHSITLNPGEAFTLPPNSNVIFTTDNDGLESICTELPDEALTCYGVVTFAQYSDNDGQRDAVEENSTYITGIEINNVTTDFVTPQLLYNPAGVISELITIGIYPMLVDLCVNPSENSSREAVKVIYQFRTLPSIAKNMNFVGSTDAPDQAGIPSALIKYPVIPYTTIGAQGHEPLCLDCPEIT